MEQFEIGETDPIPTISDYKGISINKIKYKYSITKSEKEKENPSLLIKLFDPNNKSKFYFTYEATYEKVIKDIKFLPECENLDEIIDSLTEIFFKGNIQAQEQNGEFYLEVIVIKKKYSIHLTKHKGEPKNEMEKEIFELEKKFNELLNKFEELKITKENEIKNKIKEIIFDKDIKEQLFKEMEKSLLSKYNLNKLNEIPGGEKEKEKQLENNIINKVQNVINNNEKKINEQIINIQKQLKDNLDYLNNIKINNNNEMIIILYFK